jgi:hypothetical protein
MTEKTVLDATDVVAELVLAVRRKAGKGNARHRRRGNPSLDGASIRRSAGRLESEIANVEAELDASRTVVAAPSQDDIVEAINQLKAIRALSAREAATRAGLSQLKSALETARNLKKGVQVAAFVDRRPSS